MNIINFKINRFACIYSLILGLFAWGCTGRQSSSRSVPIAVTKVEIPAFNADSAYGFVKRQVDFGPRIPNTQAHKEVSEYLVATCRGYGATVTTQPFNARSYSGKLLSLTNIIVSYSLKKQKRILLAAHWDTRPFADKDPNNPTATFDGANDGASGVGVLLEVARLLGKGKLPAVGVDIIFFDGEDFGEPDGEPTTPPPAGWDSWWCLGSQYWSKNKHKPDYSAYYGILLDMVGGKNGQFLREGVSFSRAPRIMNKVWSAAAKSGYSAYFLKQTAQDILDDHVYINDWAKIPTIDIVHYETETGYFGPYHHTQGDNMSIISKETLEAVGKTLLYVMYHEPG